MGDARVTGSRGRRSPPPAARVPLRTWLTGVALLVLLALVVLAVRSAPSSSSAGLRDAGPVVGALVPLTRMWLDLATFAVVGCLAGAGWLIPAGRPADGSADAASGTREPARRRMLRLAGRWALAWSAAAALLVVVTIAQLVGTGVGNVVIDPALYSLLWEVPQNRALVIIAVVGLGVSRICSRSTGVGAARLMLVAVSVALIPMLVSGHAGTSSSHYLAAQSLVVHVLTASLWVGGLVVLALHLRKDGSVVKEALPRFSALALCCFVALALSGVAGAWLRLGFSVEAWSSSYGAVVLAKTVALVVLGVLGAAHRSWSLPQVAAGRPLAFTRFAAVEGLAMVTATVLAVVLSRTQPPTGALTRAAPPHATTFPTVDRNIPQVSVSTLLTETRPDALVLTVAVAALLGYLLAVRHRVHGGGHWPLGRVVSFVAGVAVAAWCLCGGLGSYSGALFSADVVRLLVMALVVPALLTAGAPVLLARGPRPEPSFEGRSAPADRLLDPVNGLVLLLLLLGGVLMTPLLELSLRSPVLHTALPIAVAGAGVLFLGPLLALDRPWRQGDRTGDATLLLDVLAVLLLVYAAHIYTSATLFAENWFSRLGLTWGDAASDQQHGAFWVVGFGVALLVAGQVLGRRGELASGRQEGRRTDVHLAGG